MRILIVDDEELVADVLATALVELGHEVAIASRGVDAVEQAARNRPDAIFLDVALPDLSGIEVLRRLRERHAALPVILVTGRASAEDVAEASRLGATDILEKPLLLNRITEALSSSTS